MDRNPWENGQMPASPAHPPEGATAGIAEEGEVELEEDPDLPPDYYQVVLEDGKVVLPVVPNAPYYEEPTIQGLPGNDLLMSGHCTVGNPGYSCTFYM